MCYYDFAVSILVIRNNFLEKCCYVNSCSKLFANDDPCIETTTSLPTHNGEFGPVTHGAR